MDLEATPRRKFRNGSPRWSNKSLFSWHPRDPTVAILQINHSGGMPLTVVAILSPPKRTILTFHAVSWRRSGRTMTWRRWPMPQMSWQRGGAMVDSLSRCWHCKQKSNDPSGSRVSSPPVATNTIQISTMEIGSTHFPYLRITGERTRSFGRVGAVVNTTTMGNRTAPFGLDPFENRVCRQWGPFLFGPTTLMDVMTVQL
mmetsp:Transcript_5769/g.10217  ORF Transcript_5769/g.10217 Transcript_5769/m.10217 type:complete len:200 (+) Transcript_5769:317-916(+)